MAHFLGTIQGNRGEASRLGTKSSGLHAQIGSWEGGITVNLYYDEFSSRDMVDISFRQWVNGAGINKPIYSGPVSGK